MYAWWLKYRKRIHTPDADWTGAQPGTVIHELADIFFKGGGVNQLIFTEKFDEVFDKHFKDNPHVHFGEGTFAKNIDDARIKVGAYRNNFVRVIQPFILPYMVSEGRFGEFDHPMHFMEDVGLIGGWDLLCGENKDSPLILIDYKASDSTFYLDNRQLLLYVLGIEKMLHVKIGRAAFLLFKKPSKSLVPTIVTMDSLAQTRDWVKTQYARVKQENFMASPSKYACRLCPFYQRCVYRFEDVGKRDIIEGVVDMSGSEWM